jgi:hypothetical protein
MENKKEDEPPKPINKENETIEINNNKKMDKEIKSNENNLEIYKIVNEPKDKSEGNINSNMNDESKKFGKEKENNNNINKNENNFEQKVEDSDKIYIIQENKDNEIKKDKQKNDISDNKDKLFNGNIIENNMKKNKNNKIEEVKEEEEEKKVKEDKRKMKENRGSLTVFFEDPFWVGVFELIEDGKLSVCKVTFGAEPKEYAVLEYVLQHYYELKFSPAVQVETRRVADNPKRRAHAARKQTEQTGIGTKSQQALQLQREQNKIQRKEKRKEERLAEAERRFSLKQQKKKEKRRGH